MNSFKYFKDLILLVRIRSLWTTKTVCMCERSKRTYECKDPLAHIPISKEKNKGKKNQKKWQLWLFLSFDKVKWLLLWTSHLREVFTKEFHFIWPKSQLKTTNNITKIYKNLRKMLNWYNQSL